MNDRELLEMAALASNKLNIFVYDAEGNQLESWWNPLKYNSDALQLAVDLKLDICFYDGFGEVGVQGDFGEIVVEANEDYSDDLYVATRRAITRAAAEIGRMMDD